MADEAIFEEYVFTRPRRKQDARLIDGKIAPADAALL
jgi:hypothetical protein